VCVKIANGAPSTLGSATAFANAGNPKQWPLTVCASSCGLAGCAAVDATMGPSDCYTPDGSGDFGVQWDIFRMASDGQICNQPCAQFHVAASGDCSQRITKISSAEGVCGSTMTPTWTPKIEFSCSGDDITMTIKAASSVDGNPKTCSCRNGQAPCGVGASQGGNCTAATPVWPCSGLCPSNGSAVCQVGDVGPMANGCNCDVKM